MSARSVFSTRPKSIRVSYGLKIFFVLLATVYLPITAAAMYAVGSHAPAGVMFRVVAVALLMMLLCAALVLPMLGRMLRPISAASNLLRSYAISGVLPDLPGAVSNEADQLLYDAHHAILHMDKTLRHLTEFDQVTGLPNFKNLERALSVRITSQHHFAICAISLDNYDTIASAFGQEAVDTASRHLAQRFADKLPPGSLIARSGAKIFLFELDLTGGEDFLATRVEELRLHMQRELCLPAYGVYPNLTAGISAFHGQQVDATALINEAIYALTETNVKDDAGALPISRTHFFSPTEALATRETLLLERELRTAVELNQLSLHYQPLVDLASGRVVGAESLVRWSHPERGPISPALFIPIAEKSGLIDEIGLWILAENCRQLHRWSTTHLSNIKISMNLSVRQFLRPQVVELILEALASARIDPRLLEVELTETTMIEDHARTRKVLEEFRTFGINTAIDDFGAGFSSLSYLKTMPFDRIKIDREFVSNVHLSSKSSAICRALIELASGLEIEILAEGTEIIEEVEHLKALGCTLFQGYFFSRPVPADAFPEAVRKAESSLNAPLTYLSDSVLTSLDPLPTFPVHS